MGESELFMKSPAEHSTSQSIRRCEVINSAIQQSITTAEQLLQNDHSVPEVPYGNGTGVNGNSSNQYFSLLPHFHKNGAGL